MILDCPAIDSIPPGYDCVITEDRQSRLEYIDSSMSGYELSTINCNFYPKKQVIQQKEQQIVNEITTQESYSNCNCIFFQPDFEAWQQIFAYEDAINWAATGYEGICPDSVKAYAKLKESKSEQASAEEIIQNKEAWFEKIRTLNDVVLNSND